MSSPERARPRWIPWLTGTALASAIFGLVVLATSSGRSEPPDRLQKDAPKVTETSETGVWETDRIYVELPPSESEEEEKEEEPAAEIEQETEE
ncbi:MAG: hypothetical protein HYY16_10880 [Planctomycetes bacterium]|nr:hypothetical protein [Planctomycetota bacterium]